MTITHHLENMQKIVWCPVFPRKKMNAETHQINSRQMEQNVGCLKYVAMNLCPLTWWTRRFRAPRRLCIGPSFSLNIRSLGSSAQVTSNE